MPRKAFLADLDKAVSGVSTTGIDGVKREEGEEFTFLCTAEGQPLRITALVSDTADYPSDHTWMLFAPDDAPSSVSSVLADIAASGAGKNIIQLLELVVRKLKIVDRDGDSQMLGSPQYYDDDSDFGEEDSDVEDEYFPDDDNHARPALHSKDANGSIGGNTKPTYQFKRRIRSDLSTAKANGFKVGVLGGLKEGFSCYISLACRVAKLGISQEAMQAWQLEPSEYLVVIFNYPCGYKAMEELTGVDHVTARQYLGVRIGVSRTYKPTMQEAIRAFTVLSKEEERRYENSLSQGGGFVMPTNFRNSFISRPLNELLEERFSSLLRYRYSGMSWNGAEEFYNDHYGATNAHSRGYEDKYIAAEQINAAYPPLVTADHIRESSTPEHSLPLVGMQFVLRHFVRCTEFCLVCFAKMPDDLQAIKPYVCDKPLCLFQYMSLGFGPSIEHEILSQPKVVDLLISFCYASAKAGKLKDFPTGLGLNVPPPGSYIVKHQPYTPQPYTARHPAPEATDGLEATPMRFNEATREILFDDRSMKCPLALNQWIVIHKQRTIIHCRVVDVLWPVVKVGEPIMMDASNISGYTSTTYPDPVTAKATLPSKASEIVPPENAFQPASFHVYNQNFDELPDTSKQEAIFGLLDLLPPVEEIKKYLSRQAQSPLGSWVDRLSPAMVGILRWIIASNRACIMQVEDEDDTKGQERLYGMENWTQFRFAMGAPDKERRFVQAIRDTTDRLKLKYSTLFAWHGSPLANWHSIIREGLHFNEIAHGRAFGNGVYHSQELFTSMSYSQSGVSPWQNSSLKIIQAMALNEIVNAPAEYVSSSPHLVVAQLDWIQTRYLFVKSQTDYTRNVSAPEPSRAPSAMPKNILEQDPSRTPSNELRRPIIIPQNAISSRRHGQSHKVSNNKRRKLFGGNSQSDPINLTSDDDADSVATLEEDIAIFIESDDEDLIVPSEPLTAHKGKGKSKAGAFLSKLVGSKVQTDFVPGTLDFSTLPMLQQPTWATPGATKRLMKDFQELVKVQSETPAHELGWYVDPEKMENIYQWIVELHSFDPELALAKDMKAKNVKSIVLELRFGNSYPMSPPFVRVIRPRFLPFMQGGGGHVTAGGAMCMQLLTNDGWSAASSIESVLLQVRMAISSEDPKSARLENTRNHSDYGVGEAIEAYIRACQVHGWTVPEGFKEMALGGGVSVEGAYPN